MRHSPTEKVILDSSSENLFRDKLINQMFVLWILLLLVGLTATIVRALQIGWTTRDSLFCAIAIIGGVTEIFRNKIPARQKAIILIVVNTTISVGGVFTLGMLAGAIFFLPLSAVIIALFFNSRVVAISSLLSIAFLGLVAIGFGSGTLTIVPSADSLLKNYFHWSVYIIAFSFFLLVTGTTIGNYRQAHGKLIGEIRLREKELKTTNTELLKALDEIKTLKGILPICSYCKKIRNEEGEWEQVEVYIHNNSDVDFSHSYCPDCVNEFFPNIHPPDS